MIPKIIHYCWFGRGKMSDETIQYIESWKKCCPDYQLKVWNEDNFDVNSIAYTREAYSVGKYAFVSDVVRLYALLTEGGIYLDTDVKLLKSFDDFLTYKSFIGMETPFWVSTAVIGSESGMSWIADFYKSYEKKHFIRRDGSLKEIPNTHTLSLFLNYRYPMDEQFLSIFPIDYFSAKIYSTKEYRITENTISIHDFASSWHQPTSKIQQLKFALIRYLKLTHV